MINAPSMIVSFRCALDKPVLHNHRTAEIIFNQARAERTALIGQAASNQKNCCT
jgi:hypothetical protein